MDLFYSFNDAYAIMAGVSMKSILENNKDIDNIVFHIVDSGISKENRVYISEMIEDAGRKVVYYEIPDFELMFGQRVDTKRWNINVYSKLFAASILPVDIEKVISIDCDTIITHSLIELSDLNMDDKIVAGVNECISKYYRRILGKKDRDYYFNSGVLVFNLNEIRSRQYESKFLACMQKYGSSLAYLDQDVVNAVVEQDLMLLLPLKYNCITPIFIVEFNRYKKLRMSNEFYSKEEYDKAQKEPYIIHFTTFFLNELRPWIKNSKHPKVEAYLSYKEKTPWKAVPEYEDTRNKKKKIVFKIINVMPKFIVTSVVSVVHGYFVPLKNKKRMIAASKENQKKM